MYFFKRIQAKKFKDAEKFFKRFHGFSYHMWHDEPKKYEEYKNLNIKPELEEMWRQDIIEDLFHRMIHTPEYVWIYHGNIISVLFCTKTRVEKHCDRLLDLMGTMIALDNRSKILIIKNMEGRSVAQSDGGCCLICTRTALGDKMHAIMEQLMDFQCSEDDNLDEKGWRDMNRRRLDAIEGYQSAYSRFKDSRSEI